MAHIRSKEQLIRMGASPAHRSLILDAIEHTINGLLPEALLKGKLAFGNGVLAIQKERFLVNGRIFVIGAGKASGKMAETVEGIVPVHKGIVSIPWGTGKNCRCSKIKLIEAGHPYPDEGSVKAADEIIALASEVKEGDLLLCLISGGGSSLLAKPEEGITMDEKAAIVKAVMKAGADIGELNSLRKSLSAVKGGKLAMKFRKAKIVNILLSDVLKNSISTVASGPTVLDRYAYARAKEVLTKYGFWDPESNPCKIVERGIMVGKLPLTLEKDKPDVSSFVIGDNNLAVDVAADYLIRSGLDVRRYYEITGDAAMRGREFAELLNSGVSFVAGGETTVKVKGGGIGGRNQELALAAAQSLRRGTLASAGTDGIDGISKANGAIVDSGTKDLAVKAKLSIEECLQSNDSNRFFSKIGDGLIITGPTGTNVCDLMIGLV